MLLSFIPHETQDMMAWNPYSQVEPLRELEVRSTSVSYFWFSRSGSYHHHLGTFPLRGPICWNIIILLYWNTLHDTLSVSLMLREEDPSTTTLLLWILPHPSMRWFPSWGTDSPRRVDVPALWPSRKLLKPSWNLNSMIPRARKDLKTFLYVLLDTFLHVHPWHPSSSI